MKCSLCDNKLRSRKRMHCAECVRALQQIHEAHAHERKEKPSWLEERIERYRRRGERNQPLFA